TPLILLYILGYLCESLNGIGVKANHMEALWQNLWVKMAHPASPTGTAMEACCATMTHQRGQTMTYSIWHVTCKGIPVGRQVGTTCLGVFQCILGCKTG